MSAVESALEELFSTDPSEFTKKRDALAKQLKAAGDKDGAAMIANRRKPTLIAWVLNQLARREPDAIADLVDVGRELAREQRRALRGEAATGLRESIERQRKTITALAQKTTVVMKELGVDPAAHLDEVTSALQAALVDPVIGAQLEEGRFEKAPEAAVGFGGPIPDEIAPTRAKSAPPPPPKHHHDEHGHEAERQKAEREKAEHEEAKREKAEREEREAARKKAHAEHAKAVAAASAELKNAESAAKRARAAAEQATEDAKAAVERAGRLTAEANEKDEAVKVAEKALTKLEANAPD